MGVLDRLDAVIAHGSTQNVELSEDFQELWREMGVTARSGKRLRSSLLLAAHEACGNIDVAAAEHAAAAVELLHAAFVIHDDVIDHDLRRRGRPNVAGVFVHRADQRGVGAVGRATAGLAAAVLAGDLALVSATRELALCGADPDTTRQLLDRLTDAVRISAAGELDDVVMSTGPDRKVLLSDALTMEERKTAVYSFQLPLQLGAVLSGAPASTVDALGVVGRLAGIGFQLVDDLRGVFVEEERTGKSALGDLREGKLTPLVVHAQGTEVWVELAQYIGNPSLTAGDAATARRLLEASGSRAFIENLARDYLDTALRVAAGTGLRDPLLPRLSALHQQILDSAA